MVNRYLCKALDAYPYNLEEVTEALGYALSSEENNAVTLCLFGRVYAEQLQDYATAKIYFQDAMAADLNAVFIYPHFVQLLIDFDENDEAEKLIKFALSIKGIDKPAIISKMILLKEKLGQFKEAKVWLKNLKQIVLNEDYQSFIQKTEIRIMDKKKDKKSGK